MWALPTKAGKLDWSFGDCDAAAGRRQSGAQYALFFWVRDSYASAERVAMMVAMAALGIGIPAACRSAMRRWSTCATGQVVWFNQLARPYGDLRQAGPAGETIEALLSGFPAAR